MTITNRLKITLTPLRLHSASSVRIPNSINNFRTLIPTLRLRPLNLSSASSVNLHGLANTSIFHNNLRVMLSPLKSPVLRKYSNPFKRPGMYPSISKCNVKRCNYCMHLCTNSTVTSSVNGRKFSVVNNSDLDWKSIDLIYVLTWKTKNCNMQYVGQTCRALQKRFGEHYCRMKKPKPIDTFLYQHFKLTGHSPNDVLVQPVEKLTYDKNSSSRFKIIKRHETELKWIKLLQTPFPLGFNDNICHEGNISKMPNFDVFSLLEIRKRKSRSHGIRKKGNGKRKKRAVKRPNTSLKDLSKVLEDHGRHSMLSLLSSLPISVLRILDKGSVTSSIPAYFQNSEPPIICYKYNKLIRNTVFNFNKLVSDLDIHANTPESWDCKDSKFIYPAAGHIMTGNLKIISDSRIRYIVSKCPKYRFPSRIGFKKCREEIASALNDFGNRWCKREYVELDALKEWKVSIFKIVDQRVKFYSQNTNLLPPKPKSTFRRLKQGIQYFHRKYVFGSSRQGRKQRCCCLTVTLY